MAAKHSRHIALTEPLIAYVETQVAQGEYIPVSEVVTTALRLQMEREAVSKRRGVAPAEASYDRA